MNLLDKIPEISLSFMRANRLECPYDRLDKYVYHHLAFDEHGWFSDETREGIDASVSALCSVGDVIFPPRTAIELGSWLGRSTRHLARYFEQVIAVDHWQGSVEHQDASRDDTRDRLPILFEQFLRNTYELDPLNIVPVRMGTLEAYGAIKWPDDVDLVYVDASHDAASVFDDVFAYSELLSPRGIICGDDWQLPEVREGVEKAAAALVMEIIARGTFWSLLPDFSERSKIAGAKKFSIEHHPAG
jgi:SAM-dependent methyltransferase